MKTHILCAFFLGSLGFAACGAVDTGSQPPASSTGGRGATTKGTSGGSKGTGASSTTGGGGGKCDIDPDLCDPSIVGSEKPPLSGTESAAATVKCVVNPSTACTADTWNNYAGAQMGAACSSCHPRYGGLCDVVLSNAQLIVGRLNGNMPPGGLDATVRQRLITWINCGAPL
ncbi:MAG TPA: hypothetical protein VFH51_13700 [Myxococcota bacterium]|nr:hypothetical protein [Myxococcota bacterium]